MKRYFVLTPLFLCFVVGLRAQLNEIYTSYDMIKTEELGQVISVSYFRNLSDQTALGLRTNLWGVFSKNEYATYAGSIDIVNRWNVLKSKKFRLLAELGVSALRKYEKPDAFYFCGTISPTNTYILPVYHYNEERWIKTTYFGLVGSLGFDVNIGKYMIAGLDYTTSYYSTESINTYTQNLSPSNMRFRVGTRF